MVRKLIIRHVGRNSLRLRHTMNRLLLLVLSIVMLSTACSTQPSVQSIPSNNSNNKISPTADNQTERSSSTTVNERTSDCDPNYSPCVPIASDVDCAGGSGNGPAYVRGPIRVIGTDIYDLDRDGDGIACEK